jgi:cytochrome c peroxidase
MQFFKKNIKILTVAFAISTVSAVACQESQEPVPQNPTGRFPIEKILYFGNAIVPADNPLTYEGIDLGRYLFYDKRLSENNTVSCASCHVQELAFTDGKAQSVGLRGEKTKFGAPSLVNLLWQSRMMWDGRAQDLRHQVLMPIQDPIEMGQTLAKTVEKLTQTDLYPSKFEAAFGTREITPEKISKALSQFLLTLVSKDSKYDRFKRGEYQPTASELRGIQLFFTHPEPERGIRGGNCGDCHLGDLTSGSPFEFEGFHNNGLEPEARLALGLQRVTNLAADKGKFKTPSLRNIALTAPYMHDGRFQTLEEVIEHYDSGIQRSATLSPLIIEASNEIITDFSAPIRLHLTPQEKQDILNFLHMLTDSAFIQNPAYRNPFE